MRTQSEGLAQRAHLAFLYSEHSAYLYVREALALGAAQQFRTHLVERLAFLHLAVGVLDVFEFVEEPFVDMGELVDAVDSVAGLERGRDREDSGVCRVLQGLVEILGLVRLVADEAVGALAYHPEAFLNRLLEVASYGHDLSDALHARTYLA